MRFVVRGEILAPFAVDVDASSEAEAKKRVLLLHAADLFALRTSTDIHVFEIEPEEEVKS